LNYGDRHLRAPFAFNHGELEIQSIDNHSHAPFSIDV
jgi:hypothetical protein